MYRYIQQTQRVERLLGHCRLVPAGGPTDPADQPAPRQIQSNSLVLRLPSSPRPLPKPATLGQLLPAVAPPLHLPNCQLPGLRPGPPSGQCPPALEIAVHQFDGAALRARYCCGGDWEQVCRPPAWVF
jgi:hypothetical protein